MLTRPTRRSQRSLLTTCLAVAAMTGSAAVASQVFASDARVEVSLTDSSAQPASVFVAVSPLRVLDTRPPPNGPIGVAVSAKLAQGATMDLHLAGAGQAIPAEATSAFLNI